MALLLLPHQPSAHPSAWDLPPCWPGRFLRMRVDPTLPGHPQWPALAASAAWGEKWLSPGVGNEQLQRGKQRPRGAVRRPGGAGVRRGKVSIQMACPGGRAAPNLLPNTVPVFPLPFCGLRKGVSRGIRWSHTGVCHSFVTAHDGCNAHTCPVLRSPGPWSPSVPELQGAPALKVGTGCSCSARTTGAPLPILQGRFLSCHWCLWCFGVSL